MKRALFIFALAILLLGTFSVSANEPVVCCEKTNDGAFCQNTLADECNSDFSVMSTSCEQSPFCQLGTCVNENTGICSPNTGKSLCEDEGGAWQIEKKNEIPMCAGGCCQIGDQVAFVSQTECKQLATDYGVEISFLSNINDEPSCLALSSSEEKGACVFGDFSKDCTMTTKESCISTQGSFYEGLLCTAQELETNCARSDKQTCYEDDIYFLDTCGNLANIYDPAMFSDKDSGWNNAMKDYWTNIEDEASCEFGEIGCGDCDYSQGSTCSVDRGDYFCKDLSCEYDTNNDDKIQSNERYQHGESWCAESPGVYPHIEVDPVTMEYIDEQTYEDLSDGFNQFNLPGSRYYKLNCWEGEVIVEPCRDFRNEVCKEASISPVGDEDFTIAQCRANGWRTCVDISDKESCNDAFTDCKWLEGYRTDKTVVAEDNRTEYQGSCLPLYAPGFDFWNPGNSGLAICETGIVTEPVKYETHWLSKRAELEYDLDDAAENCIENCFALPGYGNDATLGYLEALHSGEASINKGKLISDRKGYYCHKAKDVNLSKVGTVHGTINCAESESKRKVPVFYNNQQWLDFIVERGKSLGDCGYKDSAIGVAGDNSTEIITALFQELSQKGKVKKNSTLKEVYRANEWQVEEDKRVANPFVKIASFF